MAQLQHRIDAMTDDSGFLGLVDPHAYTSFVGEDWSLEMLFERVESEMRQRTMLLWGTGGEEQWRIDLSDSPVDPRLPVISQLTDPEQDRTHEGPDFHLQLLAGRTSPWFEVAWSEL